MNVKKVFRTVSRQMLESFLASTEVKHLGNRGSIREDALKQFLLQGKLPKRYGIGSGEIVSPMADTSKQIDLIIYDSINGISLYHSDAVQVYPIESIFGVVEVKSSLSKEELIKSLENIKSVKKMSPLISGKRNSGIHSAHRGRTTGPFGIVFAYKVDRNSLASLETNLREWEAINPPSLWPNAVVVLNEGIIHHVKGLNHCYGNEEIETSNGLISIHYREDTLFHFYSILLQIASPMVLEPLALEKYFEQAEKMGPYVVNGHNRFRNSEDDSVKRLTLPFIEKIVKHCRTQEKITKRELLIRLIGEIPVGSEESDLNSFVYLYNPDNLKGVHEVDKPFEEVNGKLVSSKEIFAPWHIIFVDGECIFFPMSCLRDDDFEKVEGITVADL